MMLATRGAVSDIARLQDLGYRFDLKIDGVRCVATVEQGVVSLVSRAGVTITSQYPEIVEALRKALPHGSWELDGEIAVNDARGLPCWPLTGKRNAQVRNPEKWAEHLPATYYLFDLLRHDGDNVRGWSYVKRQEMLGLEISVWEQHPALALVLHSTDGQALWDVVVEHRLEGIVAKRESATYHSGRSADWVKIKRTSTVTCLVGGYDPGEGSRASTFGALHLYLLDDAQTLVQVGRVGSGFSNAELKRVMQALHRPPLIVEVEYLDISPDGLLRQPVFLRMRPDAGVTECTLDQLT